MVRVLLPAFASLVLAVPQAAWAQKKYSLVNCDAYPAKCAVVTVKVATPKNGDNDCSIRVSDVHTGGKVIETIKWTIVADDADSGWAFGPKNAGWGQSFVEPQGDPNEPNGHEFPVRLQHDAASDYTYQMRGSVSLGRPVRDWTVEKKFSYRVRIHYWPKSDPSNKKTCKGNWSGNSNDGDSSTDSGPFYVNRD